MPNKARYITVSVVVYFITAVVFLFFPNSDILSSIISSMFFALVYLIPLPFIVYFVHKYSLLENKAGILWKLPVLGFLFGLTSPILDILAQEFLTYEYIGISLCSSASGHCGAEIFALILFPFIGFGVGFLAALTIVIKNRHSQSIN